MEKETLKEIFRKYKSGTASPEELRIIHSFYLHKANRSPEIPDDQFVQEQLDAMDRNLFPQKEKRISVWKYAAAALIIFSSAFGMYKYTQQQLSEKETQHAAELFAAIKPGHDQATLHLPNGEVIALGQQDKLINRDGMVQLNTGNLDLSTAADNQMITLETPRGGQFQVQLEDGTQVWLNAGSTLSYPAKFVGHERSVVLKGEGYFEVAHNAKKPFKVTVGNDEIQVLGTGFNIQSYADNATPITTLVHGKVKVTRKNKAQQSLILQPGQQTLAQTNLQKANTDISGITAWKNGLFSFKRSSIKSIVRELERWYNIDFVVDQAAAENRLITGEIPRNVNLDDVMQILSYFDIQGQMKNNKVYLTIKKQ
ncbi:FecR family protein [Sphingobacterium sp. HMA12]|uniref:FecR family protein n=1 Tax=Sphingobacterium sp. HMA12 TaxID=2050894 RepID=UPI000CE9C338|nr:FecR domain-containing protein [Sphingobacterium sp. HMA12]